LPAGPERGARAMGGVVARSLGAVVLRIGAGVGGGRALRLAAPELAAAEELADQALVPRVGGQHLVGGVVDAGIQDRDHHAGAVEAQLLARAREQRIVL